MGRALAFYERPTRRIHTLAHVNSDRQMRNERRGADLGVLLCLIRHVDLVTLRVGVPTAGGFAYHLTMQRIADHAGLEVHRVYRAMSDLRRSGLVTVIRQFRQHEDGTPKNLPAIRTVSRLLFDVLSLAGC